MEYKRGKTYLVDTQKRNISHQREFQLLLKNVENI